METLKMCAQVISSSKLLKIVSNQVKRNKVRIVVLLIIIVFSVPWQDLHRPTLPSLQIFWRKTNWNRNEKVIIGIVTCAGSTVQKPTKGRNETTVLRAVAEEPLTLVKSVLISAKFWGVRKVEFHIFTDSWILEKTLQETINEFTEKLKAHVKTSTNFYSVFTSVPFGYERDFIDNVRRCGYVRLFLPTFLPKTIKEILYLDTDIVVTGNIGEIWHSFKEKVVTKFNRPKLAAMIQNSEVFDGKVFMDVYNDHFKNIPHVPPRGVNSGVIFMNLDAMRKIHWTKKIMAIWKRMRMLLYGDQQLINAFFHYHLQDLEMLPCNYNFQHLHCEKGLTCKAVETDPSGIQIMHGAGGLFQKKGRSHIAIFRAYKLFDLDKHDQVVDRLFVPLRRFYNRTLGNSNGNGRVTCQGILGRYLYKQLQEDTDE